MLPRILAAGPRCRNHTSVISIDLSAPSSFIEVETDTGGARPPLSLIPRRAVAYGKSMSVGGRQKRTWRPACAGRSTHVQITAASKATRLPIQSRTHESDSQSFGRVDERHKGVASRHSATFEFERSSEHRKTSCRSTRDTCENPTIKVGAEFLKVVRMDQGGQSC